MILLRLLGEFVRVTVLIVAGVLLTLFWIGVIGGRLGKLAVRVQTARVVELTSRQWGRTYLRILKAIRKGKL